MKKQNAMNEQPEILKDFKDILTFNEVLEILRISRTCCYQLLRTKKIKAFKIGTNYRIPKIELINYILNN